MSSSSFSLSPVHPSCCGKDVAAVVAGPCRAPRAQLCTGQGRCGLDQRPPSPSPNPSPGALQHVEHPKNQSKWWGAVKPGNEGEELSDGDGEHPPLQ